MWRPWRLRTSSFSTTWSRITVATRKTKVGDGMEALILTTGLGVVAWYGSRVVKEFMTDDRWRLDEWNALPDVCFIAACENTEIDQRGPIWLRDGSMHKACTEHWEPIMRVLGEQATWEHDAARQQPS